MLYNTQNTRKNSIHSQKKTIFGFNDVAKRTHLLPLGWSCYVLRHCYYDCLRGNHNLLNCGVDNVFVNSLTIKSGIRKFSGCASPRAWKMKMIFLQE